MKLIRIRNIREDNDVIQKDIANILGVKRSTYSMWETGDITMPLTYINKFANHFHLSIDYLLNLTDNKLQKEIFEKIDYVVIGQNIKRLRKRKALTQVEMAKILNTNQASYSYYEKGITKIPLEKLLIIAKTFDLKVSSLIKKHN